MLALVEGLPQGCRTIAAIHGEEWRGFGRTEAILADLYDVQVQLVAGKKWRKSMAYPRPAQKRKPRTLASLAPRPLKVPKGR